MAEQADTELKVAVGVLNSQVQTLQRTTARIETKIDSMAYVREADYKEDRKADAATYATKEEMKPIKNLFWAVLSTIVISLATAFITFVVKGGIR